MGDLIILKKRGPGRPRSSPPSALPYHSDSKCACGNPKPPLARACRICSWRDPQVFGPLDRATGTSRDQRQLARRAEYLLANGKTEIFEQEFRR